MTTQPEPGYGRNHRQLRQAGVRPPATPVLVLLLGLLLAAGGAAAQAPGPAKPLLIRNATVLPISSDPIPNGTVLIRNGKIAAIGRDLAAPPDAEVLDAAGQYLMPGIIDCHSHIAISGGVNEGSLSVTAMVGVEDVINPEDVDLYRDLAGGVTTANVLHGSANAIGGKNQVIKLRWGQRAEGLKFGGAPPGIKFALGENPKRGGSGARYPSTRLGVEDVIRDAFNRAREYRRLRSEYEERVRRAQPALPPRRNLELEPLVEVLEGRRLVHCHCYRADEILMMLRLSEEFRFRIATFQHVLEGYKVAPELAKHGAGASTFSDWWAYKVEAYDAIPHNAAIMARRGVLVSINSDSAEEARHLNQEAAKAVRFGNLSDAEALKLVTLNAAKQLGIDARVGSLEPGKDADLVLFNHHPLSTRALPQKVWIDGRLLFDRDQDRKRREEQGAERTRLKEEDTRIFAGGSRGAGSGEQPAPAEPRPSASAPLAPDRVTASRERAAEPRVPVSAPALTSPQNPAGNPSGHPYAIRGARIYPISGPIIASGNLVMQEGRILAVGPNAPIPNGADVVDGRGLRVYPGLLDLNTTVGLSEIDAVQVTDDTTEMGELKPHLRAYDAIHPASEHIPVIRVEGITTVLSLPQGGAFSGQAVLVDLDGRTVEEMVVRKNAGLAATIPAPSTAAGFNLQTLTANRRTFAEARRDAEQRLKPLENLLEDARHYRQAKEARTKSPALPAVPHDERLEALLPVLAGDAPLLTFANTRREIRSAVEFCEKQKLKLVIVGASEAGKMAEYLKQHDVAVIFGPVQTLPDRDDDPYDLPYATPGLLERAGVRFALSAGSTQFTRTLAFEAGTAVGSGLSEEGALKAVTLWPAQILGVADRLGSLEPGKQANLVVTDGDLLEIRARIRHVFIRGRPIPLESRHTRLWRQFEPAK